MNVASPPRPDRDAAASTAAGVPLAAPDPFAARTRTRIVEVDERTAAGKPQDDGKTVAVKVLRRRGRWLVYLAVALCAAYWYFAIATVFLSRAVPLAAGWETAAVVSGSMSPGIVPGDVVAFQPYAGQDLAPGTIVVFADPTDPDAVITHRILKAIPGGAYRTKGDANASPDSTPVPSDTIRGVVRMVVPMAGLPAYWAGSGQMLALALWATGTCAALVVLHVRDPAEGPITEGEAVPRSSRRRRSRLASLLRAVGATALLAVFAAAVLVGWTQASFAGSTDSAGNVFTALPSFGPDHVGPVGSSSCGGTSEVVTVAGTVAAGHTLVVRVALRDAAAAAPVAITDTAGNGYDLDADASAGDAIRVVVASAVVEAPLGPGDTITVTHPDARESAIAVDEFSGIAGTDRVAATATAGGRGKAPSATVTLAGGSTLVVGAVATAGAATVVQASGWATLDDTAVHCSRGMQAVGGHRAAGGAGDVAYEPTLGANREWAEAVVAYAAG